MKIKHLISLPAAITLTGWSERTFWRRFSDGSVEHVNEEKKGRSMVVLDSIIEHLLIPLTEDDVLLLLDADNGNAEAQNDLALLFLANKKFREAVYWLKLAIKQGNTSAMHCLGRAYMDGTGVPKDENLGLMWIAKAAAGGHVVSRAQMAGIIQSLPSKLPEGLQEFFRK